MFDYFQNYILVEFQYVTAIDAVMSHASFGNKNGITSAKSPVLWFRKGHLVNFHNRKNNLKTMPIFTENGSLDLNEKNITNLLYNTKSVIL